MTTKLKVATSAETIFSKSPYSPRHSKTDIARNSTTAHTCSDAKGKTVTISPATDPKMPMTATVTEK